MVGLFLSLCAAAAPPPGDVSSQKFILDFLAQVVAWHRQTASLVPDQSAEVVYADADRQLGRQGLSLAFDYAHGEAARQGADGRAQRADSAVTDAQARIKSLQAELDDLQRQLAAANPRARQALQNRILETRSELQLAQLQQQTVSALSDFAGRTTTGDLQQKIDELQRSVPEVAASTAQQEQQQQQRASADPGRKEIPTGLVALTSEVIGMRGKLAQLKQGLAATGKLTAEVIKRRTPLIEDLRTTRARGDELAAAADVSDPSALPLRARDIDDLSAHFRKVSGALVPLGKLAIVLDAFAANLNEWRSALDAQYDAVLRSLLLRLGLLIAAVGAILGASDFWRKATFRYVRDARRRQQSLLARRIVVAGLLAMVIVFSLVTEFGSIATFAGFITAGLAVALQNLILSVAAYFFLIGRSGIRVGDRVQLGGVTGDVIEVGLVRLHLMEIQADGLPTGRVTVFSNSIFFQPSAGFFKQLPGSTYAWHHVTLTLSAQTDYRHAEERLLHAVAQIFAGYRERIAQQHRQVAESVTIAMSEPEPHSALRLTDTGLEMTIRYPVPLDTAAAVDDAMTRALLDAVEREPRLRLVSSSTATIQPGPDPAAH